LPILLANLSPHDVVANKLASETSPYLLQHKDNPVDWYPWGPEALELAKREDRPILLSIGYAACHWCHVMAHESFEDAETARLMNEAFVNIKVDREERPDIDGIYMQAVQAMTGRGGWPMTVFLTPTGEPFYGGTYFPPEDRQGMPSFRRILRSIADAYANQKDRVEHTAAAMREVYANSLAPLKSSGTVTTQTLERAYRAIAQRIDMTNGGLEGAPKFPPTMVLDFMLRYSKRSGMSGALDMVLHSFRKMARGGIYDQVGGGFARYSVDAVWLVPHFEKMLYDNALLVHLGAHLWQATGDAEVRRVTEETIDWLRREMTSPEGGFYSSLDADSEGHEGKFYVWTAEELDALLGDDAELVKSYFGVTPAGNFEGQSILFVPFDPAQVAARAGVSEAELHATIARAKPILYAARARRIWPGRDEKVLAGWNGLMLRGLAEAARVFGRPADRELAITNGDFLFSRMVREGRALRSYKDGDARLAGYLEDHAALGLGALALYELTFDGTWLERARSMCDTMLRWFWDEETASFYDTAHDHETLVTRPREITDNAMPSGTSLAIDLMLRIAEVTGDADLRRRVSIVLETTTEPMVRYAPAFGHRLGVADMAVHGAVEVALVGRPEDPGFQLLARTVAAEYIPSLVLAGGNPPATEAVPLLAGRELRNGAATAYVCRQFTCEAPVTSAPELHMQLESASRVR
jgi:uncharacterized protein YyaL (SSP411 family)